MSTKCQQIWIFIVLMILAVSLSIITLSSSEIIDNVGSEYNDCLSNPDAAEVIDEPMNQAYETNSNIHEQNSNSSSDNNSTSTIPITINSTNDTNIHKSRHTSNGNVKKSYNSTTTSGKKQEKTSKKTSTSNNIPAEKLKPNSKSTNSARDSKPSLRDTNTGVPVSDSNTTNTRDQHINYKYSRNENETGVIDETIKRKLEDERLNAQQEAKRRRQQQERERESKLVTRTILHASATEQCDWKSQPLSFLRGDVCGSYYKVLGLNRKKSIFDKSDIKKLYRQKSLFVHPDKNPSADATNAFNVVQQAYECLVDDQCRMQYDDKLRNAEEIESIQRKRFRDMIVNKSLEVFSQVHFYASVAANYLYQSGIEVWNIAGEWEVEWMGYPRPIGQLLLSIALLLRGRVILLVHGVSYMLLRLNYEIAKSEGLF